MKRLKLFFACLLMAVLSIGQMWATEQTITLTYSSFGLTTSYASKNATVDGFGFTVNQGYKGSGNVIQMNSSKGSGALYNTSAISGLKSIKVNVSSGNKTYTITTGTSQNPTANSQTGTTGGTYNATSGDTYFQLKVSGASYFSSIEITYDDGQGGEDPDPVDPTITFEDGSVDVGYTLDLSTLYTSNSNGDVTYSITSGGTYATIEGSVLTGVAAGSVAVQASQAATASYNAATANSTITVNEHVVTPGKYEVVPNNAFWGRGTQDGSQSVSANSLNISIVSDDVTYNLKNNGSTNSYMKSDHSRAYDKYTLTISVPSGFEMTAITFTGSTWVAPSASVGTMSSKSWTGKANSVTFTFSGTSYMSKISVTYAAIAPEVTIDPASLSFTAKQNVAVDGKTFTLEGANLTSGLTLAASTGFTVSPTSLTAEAAMVEGGVEVTVTPATPTATTTPVEGTVTISGGGLASNVVVNLSMAVTPTYAVAVAVNNNTMGSATINGGTASIYVTEDEEIALVATPNTGYEFVNWTVSNENIILNNANAASTTAMAGAAGTITANFQVQACTGLAAPVLDEVTTTYQSATIAWNAVDNAEGYVLNLKKHEGNVSVVTDELIVAPTVSFEKAGLDANTQYDYTVMAVGDGTSYCDASNPVYEGNFTTSDYPAATLTLSEVGAEKDYTWGSGLKLNSEIALPSSLQHSEGCSGKVLVGWSSVAIAEPGDKPTANYWEAGADYTMLSTADKLYAVYATATGGAGDSWVINTSNFDKAGSGNGYALYNGDHTLSDITYNTSNVMLQSSKIQFKSGYGVMYNKTEFSADIVSIEIDGISSNITVYEGEEEISTGGTAVTLADGVYPFSAGKRFFRIKMGSATGQANSITVNLAGALSYSDYTTDCEAALPVLDAPTGLTAGTYYEAQTITLTATNGAAIYYSLDGNDPTVDAQHLYSEPFTLSERDVVTVKAIAVKSGYENSPVATAEYNINLPYDFADFAALEKVNNKEYAVRGIISQIDELYNNSKLIYHISGNGSTEGQIKCFRGLGLNKATFSDVTDVNLGDNVTVVGTWSTQYKNLNQDNWMLEYTARVHDSYEIVGGLTSTTFQVGEAFDNAILGNLSVKEVFTNGYEETVAGATFNCGDKTEWLENETSLTVYAKLGDDDLTSKNFGVTVSSATLVSFALKEGYKTEYYVGDEFVKPTVIATLTDNTHPEAEATVCTGYDMSAAGNYTVNVAFTYGDITIDEGVTYQITVKAVFGNEDAPHTVAKAIELIEASAYQAKQSSTDYMWVSGKVSGFNGTSNKNYYISDDGTATGQLYVYSGSYFGGVAFTDANKLHVGDEVILKATILNYNGSTAELTNSQVVSQFRAPEFAFADIVADDEFEENISEDLTVVPTANSGEAEFTLTSDNPDAVTIVEGKLHAEAEGDAVITATRAATANENALNYKEATTTFNVHVIAERTRYTVSFDADGGTGTDPVIANQLPGATVELPENPYSKESSAFAGWVVNDGAVEITDGQFTMPEGNVTIKATWNVVAICAISFKVNGTEVATANAPQTAEFSLADVSHPTVPGFTWVGWSETEYADEVENAPAMITTYTPEAGEATKVLYGIYSRVEGEGETNHYVLDYAADGIGEMTLGYGNAVNVTAKDGSEWIVKAYKSNGMQINTSKNASIKIPTCPGKIFSIAITTSTAKSVGLSASDYSGTGTITYIKYGTDAASQTLDLSGETVTAGYIVPKGGNAIITNIDVEFDASKTYYTSSPVEKVTITFNANGGEGGCQKAIINKGSELTICENVPTKSHSEFAGWKLNETTTIYQANQNIGEVEEDIMLTAQWNDAATYAVTYNVNGSSDAAPTQEAQYAGDQFEVGAAVTKEGFTFQGWKYGSKLYKAGASFTMPAEAVEFVAQWRKASVPVDKMSMVTSASALSNGMQIALGCSYGENSFAMAGDIASGKSFLSSETENITLSNGVATYTEDVVIMTLEQVANGWKITKDGMKYLNETSVKNLAWTTKENATTWSISFSGNNVKIESENGSIQYNSTSPRFTTYASGQKDIQLFGKAVVVTEDASISDLGYTEGEAIIASGEDVTLTIDEPTTVPSITATNGATVKINKPTTAKSVNVEEGSKIEANEPTTTPVVTFATTLGSSNTPSTGSALGSADNITLAAGGEIHYDITLGVDMTTDAGKEKAADQWHAFTVPFPVDVLNGIYNAATDAKLTNEVDYAIMDYHGDIRANGDYGWKKYRGTLVPGKFYLMTINGDVATFRFKMSVAAATVLQALNSMAYTAYGVTDPENTTSDQGWNGIGNPSWVSVTVGFPVQVLDPYSYEYQTLPAGTVISASTPFFYKANANSTMTMTESNANAQYAPRRTPANEIKNMAVRFGNEVFADKLYVTASEDALNSYEQDKDLVKMTMSKTPKVAQIFGDAYGMKLSMVNTPLVNNNAEVALTLYAPNAGEYTISAPAMEEADLYLTKDGAIIWNLSTSEYTNDFEKGNNEGYGLLLIKKITGISTGVENIEAAEAGVQKVVIDDKVFILRGEKMYDVTGKMVK